MRKTLSLAVMLSFSFNSFGAESKKRVAVLDFDYAAVHSGVSAIFGSNTDVGKGVADLLVERLVTSGRYSVIERKAISKILAEQNLSNSDRVDASTAAKLGRILGVEAVVIGSITQFGRDDKQTSVGGFGSFGGRYGLGRVGVRESKAVVGINARIVNVETAEILAVATGRGESSRSGTSLLGSGGQSLNLGGGDYDMTSHNFAGTIIGEATTQAVQAMARQLDSNADRVRPAVSKVEGLVADVSGATLVLNIGGKSGVKIGDRLEIRRVAREIKDPATGQIIRRVVEKVGECQITEVDEASSVAQFAGSGEPKVGDGAGRI